MRTDRDQYIKVHYENIEPGKHNQFKVVTALEATTYNVPYDYTSDIIGTRADASPSDYRKICEIYECNECNGARGSNGFGNGNGITGIGNGNGMTGIGNGNDITGMGNGNGITGIDNGNGITGIDNGNHIVRPEPYTAMPRRGEMFSAIDTLYCSA
ncbi:astacin [Oesophagostomum dentatum]|uniref:Astacin n=1 Tax=Oesophagostomum dentatum TaxID=61180 RepID=A0A0B1TBQ1_OESDE|nr:astacin [Oesophagostomum dentatum]